LSVRAPSRPRLGIGAGGRLRRSSTVLLLVDVINPLAFDGAEKIAASAESAARAIARLKARLGQHGVATIYANDNYGQWRSDFRDLLANCQRRTGASASLANLLAPRVDDLVILKPRQSAFFATPLDLLLTQMHTRELVIAGIAADICVQLTAMDANLRGYRLWIPSDCTAAESAASKTASLGYMRRVLKADTRASSRRREL